MRRRTLLAYSAFPAWGSVPVWAQGGSSNTKPLQISTLLEQDPATSIAEQW